MTAHAAGMLLSWAGTAIAAVGVFAPRAGRSVPLRCGLLLAAALILLAGDIITREWLYAVAFAVLALVFASQWARWGLEMHQERRQAAGARRPA